MNKLYDGNISCTGLRRPIHLPQLGVCDRPFETVGCRLFVDALPDGDPNGFGRSGDKLSVGQHQRLSIARLLLRHSSILILDEPTAALDPQTERELVSSLQEAAKDRLVIVIAHRLSTIRHADRIVFLEDGTVWDVGDHASLMAKPESPYRGFIEWQSGAPT